MANEVDEVYEAYMADIGTENLAKSRESELNQSKLLTEVRCLIDDLIVQEYGRVHQVDKDTECAKLVIAKTAEVKDNEWTEKLDNHSARLTAVIERDTKRDCQRKIETVVEGIKKELRDLSFRHNPIGKQRIDNFIKFIDRLRATYTS